MVPANGTFLIADPFLKDPNFARTVVLLCEHQAEGSFGFVINRPFEQTLNELLPGTEDLQPIPLYFGGPVQLDTVHFIHQYPDVIEDGYEVGEGIYWGGNFEQTLELIRIGVIDLKKIKFFIGYSGWGSGQLEAELEEHSWIVSPAHPELIFDTRQETVWKQSLRELGDEYALMANFPIDPSLN
ncbi:MAG: YqgE/AlgH family protein [Thermoflavifilum sp.]|uniref:YqgE/AlgH family protein n=1 Tax=Thermoflavifilum sp. TaxID=1968839 RepID=UPI0018A3958E|nr:YqgE/AlgH family protein [Thermoflavifilum sp.]QOR75065.1 MAG: YqgE/AlgH family protein [Thermoflavifilum sp.]